MMQGNRVSVKSNRMLSFETIIDSGVHATKTDIGALASKDRRTAAIMLWNYHDDDILGDAEPVAIEINGLPAKELTLIEYRIDQQHSNSYEVWKQMGSPQNPTAAQIAQLEKAGSLQTIGQPKKMNAKNGKLNLTISLPGQAVSLIKISW
jgi:xylan 1,4-beta-xylosidase